MKYINLFSLAEKGALDDFSNFSESRIEFPFGEIWFHRANVTSCDGARYL